MKLAQILILGLFLYSPAYGESYTNYVKCTTWNTNLKLSDNGYLEPDTLDGKFNSKEWRCDFFKDPHVGKAAACEWEDGDLTLNIQILGDKGRDLDLIISTSDLYIETRGDKLFKFLDRSAAKQYAVQCTVI